jgi:hypothetical protein
MRAMNPDKIQKMLENDPNLIKHEVVKDRLVLTASTEELQKFMKTNANVEDFFGEATEYKRMQSEDPNVVAIY